MSLLNEPHSSDISGIKRLGRKTLALKSRWIIQPLAVFRLLGVLTFEGCSNLIALPSKSVQPIAASLERWEKQRDRYLETLSTDKRHP